MLSIYKRELRSYFTGFMGYLFIAVMLLFVGIYVSIINLSNAYPTFEFTLYNLDYIYLIIVPIITMRIFAEDRRRHTSELLYSLPLKLSSIVLGKYLALLTVLAIPCAVYCCFPAIFSLYGAVDIATSYSSILAFFLMGAALLAIGMFMSSLTENQLIAAVLSFGAVLLSYLMASLTVYVPSSAYGSLFCFVIVILLCAVLIRVLTKSTFFAACCAIVAELILSIVYICKASLFEGLFSKFLSALSVYSRYENFMAGLFDWNGLVYYLTVIVLFLFFSTLSLEKRRWS